MSVIFHNGLDGVSTHTSRVFARIAARTAATSVMSTNVVSSFQRAKVSRRSRDRAVVGVHRGDHVIAGLERQENRRGRGRGRRERGGGRAALESRQALLERLAIGVVVARIEEAARVRAVRVALERRGRMDGLCDRAGAGIDVRAGVDRDRFDPHLRHPLIFWPLGSYSGSRLTIAVTVSPKSSIARRVPGVDATAGTYAVRDRGAHRVASNRRWSPARSYAPRRESALRPARPRSARPGVRQTSLLVSPSAFCFTSASRPMKSPLSRRTQNPSPASSGVCSGVTSALQ